MTDESASVQKIPLAPGEWVRVEFYGRVPREGTVPGAIVYLRTEIEPLANELGKVFGFSHIDGLTVAPGGTLVRPVPIRRRDPAEAAERIRSGYREAGIPEDLAEAMIEEALRDEG